MFGCRALPEYTGCARPQTARCDLVLGKLTFGSRWLEGRRKKILNQEGPFRQQNCPRRFRLDAREVDGQSEWLRRGQADAIVGLLAALKEETILLRGRRSFRHVMGMHPGSHHGSRMMVHAGDGSHLGAQIKPAALKTEEDEHNKRSRTPRVRPDCQVS